jgi:membrane-associated phospholipid phosphatase
MMVPGPAGMALMPYGAFVFRNAALGGLTWGTTFVLPRYFAGAAWQRVTEFASKVGLGLLVLVLLGLVTARALRGLRDRGKRVSDRLAGITPFAWACKRFPRLGDWLARRADATSPRGFLLSFVVVAGAICGWVFGALTQDVVAHEEFVKLDPGITRFVIAHRMAWLTPAMKGITWLGSNAVLVPVIVITGGYFFTRRRDWRPAAFLVAAFAGQNVLFRVVKSAVERPRPPLSLQLIGVSGFSFPSGHATAAIACWGMVAIVLGTGRRGAVGVWLVSALIVILVGFSRLYLGVHWWTDVVGGVALGGLWLCVLALTMLSTSRGSTDASAVGLESKQGRPPSASAA